MYRFVHIVIVIGVLSMWTTSEREINEKNQAYGNTIKMSSIVTNATLLAHKKSHNNGVGLTAKKIILIFVLFVKIID